MRLGSVALKVFRMQHTMTCPLLKPTDLEPDESFKVVIAYEDFETGKHAKRTYDFLVESLGRNWHFENQMWKFDVLTIPKLREIASDDAAAADIVVISCHGHELPAHIKAWIDSWLVEATKPLALVALFDGQRYDLARPRNAVRAYLSEVARKGGMEFFAQPDEWPGETEGRDHYLSADNESINERTLSTLAGVIQREVAVPRWEAVE
jgi:hypothetical protein